MRTMILRRENRVLGVLALEHTGAVSHPNQKTGVELRFLGHTAMTKIREIVGGGIVLT